VAPRPDPVPAPTVTPAVTPDPNDRTLTEAPPVVPTLPGPDRSGDSTVVVVVVAVQAHLSAPVPVVTVPLPSLGPPLVAALPTLSANG
jgi:hypothetical protein